MRERLGDRTYAVERIDTPETLADGTVRVQLHSVIDRVRAVETLTLRSIEGEWRIAELSSHWV